MWIQWGIWSGLVRCWGFLELLWPCGRNAGVLRFAQNDKQRPRQQQQQLQLQQEGNSNCNCKNNDNDNDNSNSNSKNNDNSNSNSNDNSNSKNNNSNSKNNDNGNDKDNSNDKDKQQRLKQRQAKSNCDSRATATEKMNSQKVSGGRILDSSKGSMGWFQSRLRSRQVGLFATMRRIFLMRSQPLISDSRAIA